MDPEEEETPMDFPQHSTQVLEQLNQQRQLGLLCDCTFVVDGINFKAHKAVLAACKSLCSILVAPFRHWELL
uniref:BTB domain-containing protein n=1 Tax=Amazona collaria TaxID=241587 RepID=A0A8B9FWL0_9PSIT